MGQYVRDIPQVINCPQFTESVKFTELFIVKGDPKKVLFSLKTGLFCFGLWTKFRCPFEVLFGSAHEKLGSD